MCRPPKNTPQTGLKCPNKRKKNGGTSNANERTTQKLLLTIRSVTVKTTKRSKITTRSKIRSATVETTKWSKSTIEIWQKLGKKDGNRISR